MFICTFNQTLWLRKTVFWGDSQRDRSVLCRFGLLPLSMSNVRKSKSASRSSDAAQQLVSNPAGLRCLTPLCVSVVSYADNHSVSSFLCFIVLFHPALMLSVTPSAFPALLSARDTGKFISMGRCLCVFVCVVWLYCQLCLGLSLVHLQCIINWWDDSRDGGLLFCSVLTNLPLCRLMMVLSIRLLTLGHSYLFAWTNPILKLNRYC